MLGIDVNAVSPQNDGLVLIIVECHVALFQPGQAVAPVSADDDNAVRPVTVQKERDNFCATLGPAREPI
ncbi:hypothetical protein D3C86_2073640 [compost metagenome]